MSAAIDWQRTREFITTMPRRYLRSPRMIFAIASSLFILVSGCISDTVSITEARIACFLVIFVTAFYLAFLAPNGKEWGEQRRQLLEQVDRQTPVNLPKHVIHNTAYLERDGVLLFTQTYEPRDHVSKGLVLILHGYSDHTSSRTKRDLAYWLVGHHYTVAALDARGHGRSDGLHVYLPSFEPLIDDLQHYVELLCARFHIDKVLLYSESMGGAFAFLLSLRIPQRIAGSVFSAPMCAIAPEMQPPQAVTNILLHLERWMPTLPAVPTPDVAHYTFKKREMLDLVQSGPIFYARSPRLSTAACILFSSQNVANRLRELSVPFLIQHGTDDKVTSPEMSKRLVREACSTDKELKLYDGAWHALMCDDDQTIARVKKDLIEWLDKHCAKDKTKQ